MNNNVNKLGLIGAIVAIVLVLIVWFITIQDGRRLMEHGDNNRGKEEPVPYDGREHGENH